VWPRADRPIESCAHAADEEEISEAVSSAASGHSSSGAHLAHFEQHIANLFGVHGAAFFVDETMAHIIALRVHALGKNQIFATHSKAALLTSGERVSGD
jgi:dTDP-4-amino-4,6-dideoxygalactose transaminase